MLTRQLAIISKYIQISNSKVYLKLTILYVNYTSIFKKQKKTYKFFVLFLWKHLLLALPSFKLFTNFAP